MRLTIQGCINIAAVKSKKDGWSKKSWYAVEAPKFLGGDIVAEVPVLKANELSGRNIVVPLSDLTKNFRDFKTKVKLRITGVEGNKATTEYYGQEMIKDQLARIIRRWSSRIDSIEDIVVDGKKLRIKSVAISRRRVNTSVKNDLRAAISEKLKTYGEKRSLDQVVSDINTNKMQKELVRDLSKIYPVRILEVRMIEVLK